MNKNIEISLSNLSENKRDELIAARVFVNQQSLKYFGRQFSHNHSNNKEIIALFYKGKSPELKITKVLELGLSYYFALIISQCFTGEKCWTCNHDTFSLKYKSLTFSGSRSFQSLKKFFHQYFEILQ